VGDVESLLRIFEQQAGAVVGGFGEDNWVVGLADAEKKMIHRLRTISVHFLAIVVWQSYLCRSCAIYSSTVVDTDLMYPVCHIDQVGSENPRSIDSSRPWRRVRILARDFFTLDAATVQLGYLICRSGRFDRERFSELVAVHFSREMELDRDGVRGEQACIMSRQEFGDDRRRYYKIGLWYESLETESG